MASLFYSKWYVNIKLLNSTLMNQAVYVRQVHSAISRKVAYFHNRGYIFDFAFSGPDRIICLQDNLLFLIENVVIREIYQAYDTLSHAYKLIYTVDTCCGYRGLIMRDIVCKEEVVF